MSRPVHFEIHADNPARAIKFYRKVFGWSFKKFSGGPMPYWLITTGPDKAPGINGGLHRVSGQSQNLARPSLAMSARSELAVSTICSRKPSRPVPSCALRRC